jgi:hypothetical protein
MNRILFFCICLFSVLLTVKVNAQLLLPVRNLQADYFLNTSWDAPRKTILTQDFEGVTFPPTGWQERTNHAVGWYMSEGGSSTYFIIPEHTQYALVNDDAGGTGIDGCCEYLITPALDLTVCDGFKLTFDSYYNGNNGQKATVEMSTDNGLTWSLVEEMIHYPTWNQVEIDLSQWSGNGGLSSVLFAFHADDQGNQASGWAVDNVVIQSDSLGVTGYTLFLNQNQIAVITETEYFISPDLVTFGQDYSFCVRANYPSDYADTCVLFASSYVPPPANLTATASDTSVWFTWQTPISVSEIISYNIYSNGALIANVPVAITSWFSELEFGEACIDVTAVHDISIYGFPPGSTVESVAESACGFVDTGFDLPFGENWTSGTLTINKWTAGSNWSVTGQVGNDAPSVKYEGGKSPGSYSSALTSWHFNSMGFSECPSITGAELNFFIRLDDVTASKTEVLIVEIVTGNGITELKRYTNNGSFSWLNEWIEITPVILDDNFQVRFRVEGENSQNIETWYIDNIKVNWYISDFPDRFAVDAVRQGMPEDDIKITWLDYTDVNVTTDIIVDDGTAESQFSMGTNGELWIGNKLTALDSSYLFKASVYMKELQGTSAIYTIDIFDENRNLMQSSMPFVPVNNAFIDVYLNGTFLQGEFYIMLHISSTGYSHSLGIDTDGSNASNELSWVFDGTNWNRLVDGFGEGVFSLRASTMISTIMPVNDNHCGFLGYNIYRRDYSVFPTGPNNNGSGEYTWIGSVPYGVNEFIDTDLDNFQKNCYEYDVRIQYSEGEGYGGISWDCIYVNMEEPEKVSVNIYPNPASHLLMVKMNMPVELITVYNLTGSKIAEFSVENQSEIELNVSHFKPGIYNLRFNTIKGESFSRKFVKL